MNACLPLPEFAPQPPKPRAVLGEPTSRRSDPPTSAQAAQKVTHANEYVVKRIVSAVGAKELVFKEGSTADQIVRHLEHCDPDRWAHGTIVSAISRAVKAELIVAVKGKVGTSDRGQPCSLYKLGEKS